MNLSDTYDIIISSVYEYFEERSYSLYLVHMQNTDKPITFEEFKSVNYEDDGVSIEEIQKTNNNILNKFLGGDVNE